MHLRRTCSAVLALMLIGMTGPGGLVRADTTAAAPNGLLPLIPQGRGERCVEDTAFMRRNHMDLLDHQRDETMLQGIRGKPFSLKECLDCHVVHGPGDVPVTAASPAHFCRACHDYAAVSIDCFQCHASRPEPVAQNGAG